MILKINYTQKSNGEIVLNKLLKVKREKVKPKFDGIDYSPYQKIYSNRIDKGNFITDVQYVYLFNTDSQRFIYYERDSQFILLNKLAKPIIMGILRDSKIDEIFED